MKIPIIQSKNHNFVFIILSLVRICISECPNACSGNGICKSHDTCDCYKGWIGNDCSLSKKFIFLFKD
jgi:hypothetical protein